jgi:hypothetical protein
MDIEGNEENELRWNNIMTIGLMDNEGTLIRKWITSESGWEVLAVELASRLHSQFI